MICSWFCAVKCVADVCIFSVDDKYANQGKLGAAIIGNHSACDVSPLISV